jgi:hypothetical protein
MHITVLDSKRKPLIVQVVKALFVVYERHGWKECGITVQKIVDKVNSHVLYISIDITYQSDHNFIFIFLSQMWSDATKAYIQ